MNKETFGKRLADLRKRRNLTQTQLSERIGMSHSSVASWETGTREPAMAMIVKLAHYFNVSADYLLGTTDDPNGDVTPSVKDNTWPSSDQTKLSPKDERDIAKELERIMNNLEGDKPLAFNGEPIDEEDRELLRISLENSLRIGKQRAKRKFTPNKHKK